jgi:ssDNA-binding Zn-finger/Zn-ribbon topoisomerase 1
MTNSKSHLHDIYKCDKCNDGYIIVKLKGDEAFYGCTGYDSHEKSGCGNMQRIYARKIE